MQQARRRNVRIQDEDRHEHRQRGQERRASGGAKKRRSVRAEAEQWLQRPATQWQPPARTELAAVQVLRTIADGRCPRGDCWRGETASRGSARAGPCRICGRSAPRRRPAKATKWCGSSGAEKREVGSKRRAARGRRSGGIGSAGRSDRPAAWQGRTGSTSQGTDRDHEGPVAQQPIHRRRGDLHM